jgi:hypothetical protein
MDKDVLDQQLESLCRKAMCEARSAVDLAPDGQWIAASEWSVRDIFQRLTRDCYQLMLQAKADGQWTANQAAFSPGGGRDIAKPGRAFVSGVNGRRRD